MDFRIIEIVGPTQILLERIQDDDEWQVIISIYVDKENRYDEWIKCDSADQAREFIETFPVSKVYEFTARAVIWQNEQLARMDEDDTLTELIRADFQPRKRIASA